MTRILRTCLWPLALLAAVVHAETANVEFTVNAGKHDRANVPIRVPLAQGAAMKSAILKDAEGKELPAQISVPALLANGVQKGELNFILPSLKAGQSAVFKATLSSDAPAEVAGFKWSDTPNDYMDLKFGERPVLRYMDKTLDTTSKESRALTFKVFHHVFDPATGQTLMTKGAGGDYTHHRGIFYGFRECIYGDNKKTDIWHCPVAWQGHAGVKNSAEGQVLGRHCVNIDWHGIGPDVFAKEERELTAYNIPGGTLIDFASRLKSTGGTVKLGGDLQHAGFHFRASADLQKTFAETTFLRSTGVLKKCVKATDPGESKVMNLDWDAMNCTIGGKRYSVLYLDRPQNSKPVEFSERAYGRFGSFFPYKLEEGKTLDVAYRLWLQEGEIKAEQAAALSADFAEPPEVVVK